MISNAELRVIVPASGAARPRPRRARSATYSSALNQRRTQQVSSPFRPHGVRTSPACRRASSPSRRADHTAGSLEKVLGMSTIGTALDRLVADMSTAADRGRRSSIADQSISRDSANLSAATRGMLRVEPWIRKRDLRAWAWAILDCLRPQVGLNTPNSPACRSKYHKTRMLGCRLPLFVEGCPDSQRWRRRP